MNMPKVGNYYFNETVADQFVTARPNQLHASTKILPPYPISTRPEANQFAIHRSDLFSHTRAN